MSDLLPCGEGGKRLPDVTYSLRSEFDILDESTQKSKPLAAKWTREPKRW